MATDEHWQDMLDCPICLNTLRPPIKIAVPCGHRACETCILNWINVKKQAKEERTCWCRAVCRELIPDQFAEKIVEHFYKKNPCVKNNGRCPEWTGGDVFNDQENQENLMTIVIPQEIYAAFGPVSEERFSQLFVEYYRQKLLMERIIPTLDSALPLIVGLSFENQTIEVKYSVNGPTVSFNQLQDRFENFRAAICVTMNAANIGRPWTLSEVHSFLINVLVRHIIQDGPDGRRQFMVIGDVAPEPLIPPQQPNPPLQPRNLIHNLVNEYPEELLQELQDLPRRLRLGEARPLLHFRAGLNRPDPELLNFEDIIGELEEQIELVRREVEEDHRRLTEAIVSPVVPSQPWERAQEQRSESHQLQENSIEPPQLVLAPQDPYLAPPHAPLSQLAVISNDNRQTMRPSIGTLERNASQEQFQEASVSLQTVRPCRRQQEPVQESQDLLSQLPPIPVLPVPALSGPLASPIRSEMISQDQRQSEELPVALQNASEDQALVELPRRVLRHRSRPSTSAHSREYFEAQGNSAVHFQASSMQRRRSPLIRAAPKRRHRSPAQMATNPPLNRKKRFRNNQEQRQRAEGAQSVAQGRQQRIETRNNRTSSSSS